MDVFWFEIVWILRRLAFSVALFVTPETDQPLRTAVVISVFVISLAIQNQVKPFTSSLENRMEEASMAVLLLTFATVLSSGEQATFDRSRSLAALQIIMFIINILVVIGFIVALVRKPVQRWIAFARTKCCKRS